MIPLEKRLRRVLIEVLEVRDDVFVVSMPRWRENFNLHLKKSLVPDEIVAQVIPGSWLLASANAETPNEEDLEFHDFEFVEADLLSDNYLANS